jgi:hypothetical protein
MTAGQMHYVCTVGKPVSILGFRPEGMLFPFMACWMTRSSMARRLRTRLHPCLVGFRLSMELQIGGARHCVVQ